MEIWKDIPRLEGRYQLSSKGRVRSLARVIIAQGLGKGRTYLHKGKILKYSISGGSPHYVLRTKTHENVGFTVRIQVLKSFGNYDSSLRIKHLDGDRTNCAIDNLEQYSDKTDCNIDLPHICMRGCGAIAKTMEEADELFHSVVMNDKKYYRGDCLVCRRERERVRMRERVKKERYKRACNNPTRYSICYDCGNVELKTKKACTECNSTELSQFEEI